MYRADDLSRATADHNLVHGIREPGQKSRMSIGH